MSEDRTSALKTLGLDLDDLPDIVEDLADTEPAAAAVLEALATLIVATDEHMGDSDAKPLDLRRSEVAVFAAMAAETCYQLGAILKWINLTGWVTDADLIEPVDDAGLAIGEGLIAIARDLSPNNDNE